MNSHEILPGAHTQNRLNALFKLDVATISELLDPDFRRYFAASFEARKLMDYDEEAREYVRLAGWSGPVLDFGCGYGIMSICLRAAGVEDVLGADIRDCRIRTCKRLADWVGCGGVRYVTADTRLEFPRNTFGGILVKDALSHLSTEDAFLHNAFRVLRPGGVLLISEDRNSFNPRTQLATRMLWSVCESGDVADLRRFGLQQNWRDAREAHLRLHFPNLPSSEIRRLAISGRGYTNDQLSQILSRTANGRGVQKRLASCVDPTTGIVQERLINPLGLVRELRAIGFQVWIAPPRKWQITLPRQILRSLWPLTIPIAPYFYAIARKPSTTIH